MSDTHDENSNPQSQDGAPMLLEVRRDGEWTPIRVARNFPGVHAALDSLPMFARQQKVYGADDDFPLADVRVKELRTDERVTAAERAVRAYNTRTEGYEECDG